MRKSFNGLCAYVQAVLQEEPFSGHLFVFTNRLRKRRRARALSGTCYRAAKLDAQ